MRSKERSLSLRDLYAYCWNCGKRWIGSKAYDEAHDEAHDEAQVDVTETESRGLQALRSGPLSTPELLLRVGVKSLSGGLKKALDRLAEVGLIEFTIPDKPRSKKQKRRLTGLGERVAQELSNPALEEDV